MVRVGQLLKNKVYLIMKKNQQFSKRRNTSISASKVLGHVRDPSGRNFFFTFPADVIHELRQRENVLEEERDELRKAVEGKIEVFIKTESRLLLQVISRPQ